jgi:hypothetical protein
LCFLPDASDAINNGNMATATTAMTFALKEGEWHQKANERIRGET